MKILKYSPSLHTFIGAEKEELLKQNYKSLATRISNKNKYTTTTISTNILNNF